MVNTNYPSGMSSANRQAMLSYYAALRSSQTPASSASSQSSASSPPQQPVDVVIVDALRVPNSAFNLNLAWSDSLYELGDPNTLGLEEAADQFDQLNIDITDHTGRALTPSEQAAINKMREVIDQAKARINAMPDNATLRLSDGRTVTGRELKDVIARLDVEIYDGRSFGNNSHLNRDPVSNKIVGGEADYNGGNPVIRLNIGGLEGYNRLSGGVEYLFLHEVGHMTPAGLENLAAIGSGGMTTAESVAHERMANDIARALATYVGLPTMANPGGGYDPLAPAFELLPILTLPPSPPTPTDLPTYFPPRDWDWR